MVQYEIHTIDALTAHRVAGAIYSKLVQPPYIPTISKRDLDPHDLVPGSYTEAGYHAQLEQGSFDVLLKKTKPKSGRDYHRDFEVFFSESGSITERDFERAVREVKDALGRKGRA
ncbi:hypothetical protein J4444_00305 [Candidatus Woesearchaeota archaeon]|nr:hypothetical protein [Candidatus Woesearchaeota archaeon]